jgi:hypothetical protein
MTINNLLLRQSKGTVFEGLARSVAMQQFQNVSGNSLDTTHMSKGAKLVTLVFMIILLVVATYGIPYAIYASMQSKARHEKSIAHGMDLVATTFIIVYFMFAAAYIYLILLFIIALLIALAN